MIEITLLGSGGATPYIQRTTPMVFAHTDETNLLFDCGSGATLRLAQAGYKAGIVDALFFTHFHADHCVDFPIFLLTSYLAERKSPLRVYGPEGTARFVKVMLDELFSYIPRLISNITNTEFSIEVNELSPNDSVVFGTSVVHASAAKHGVPAFCYRFETITESVTISGDTEFSEDVIEASRGSSLLIHECPFPSQIGATPGHTTPHQVGIVANEAKVECVVLTHLFEEVMGFEDQIRQDVKVSYPGRVVIGEDLMKIVVERENIRTFTS